MPQGTSTHSIPSIKPHRPTRPRPRHRWLPMAGLLSLGLLLPGCSNKRETPIPNVAPTPTFTGPMFLRGSIGSLTHLRHAEPLLVEGYGVVMGLEGTGSSEVPAFLREWLINQLRRDGLGSARQGTQQMSPERVLASLNTAVVLVQGLLPAGASPGTRFDVLVTALPGTQTTSLAGGELWPLDLAFGGANPQMAFSRPSARAMGQIYIDPARESSLSVENMDFQRQAIIVAGGQATESRPPELILNSPSWTQSRLISDRINERFEKGANEKFPTAVAKNDLVIQLNIPRRFAQDPESFLLQINHLFTQRIPRFEPLKAEELAEHLRDHPQDAPRVVLAWRGLGRTTIPVLRRYFEDESLLLRLSALEAAASLGDERASVSLQQLAQHASPEIRIQVARGLAHLPRSIRGAQTLQGLLNDTNDLVRIAAYESLAFRQEVNIDRLTLHDSLGNTKFAIDRVAVDRPLIYVTPHDVPRVVIFGNPLGFQTPGLARLWDRQLMLRTVEEMVDVPAGDQTRQVQRTKLDLFWQPTGQTRPLVQALAPTVATLVYALGSRPSAEMAGEGLNLSFSQVVDALYQLCQNDYIPAPIIIRESPLARMIDDHTDRAPRLHRPETSPGASPEPPPAASSSPLDENIVRANLGR